MTRFITAGPRGSCRGITLAIEYNTNSQPWPLFESVWRRATEGADSWSLIIQSIELDFSKKNILFKKFRYFSTKLPITERVWRTKSSMCGRWVASEAGMTWDGKLLSLSTDMFCCGRLEFWPDSVVGGGNKDSSPSFSSQHKHWPIFHTLKVWDVPPEQNIHWSFNVTDLLQW